MDGLRTLSSWRFEPLKVASGCWRRSSLQLVQKYSYVLLVYIEFLLVMSHCCFFWSQTPKAVHDSPSSFLLSIFCSIFLFLKSHGSFLSYINIHLGSFIRGGGHLIVCLGGFYSQQVAPTRSFLFLFSSSSTLVELIRIS